MRRTTSADPRRLSEIAPSAAVRSTLAGRARFAPYAKHKKNPALYGLAPWRGEQEDPSYCDAHAGFMPADIPRASALLQRGILAGLFGKSAKKGDPNMLWSVDDDGWIYEAMITNPGYAVYHAYPVLPNEAIARKVLMRYADYVVAQNQPDLRASLRLAQGRYR